MNCECKLYTILAFCGFIFSMSHSGQRIESSASGRNDLSFWEGGCFVLFCFLTSSYSCRKYEHSINMVISSKVQSRHLNTYPLHTIHVHFQFSFFIWKWHNRARHCCAPYYLYPCATGSFLCFPTYATISTSSKAMSPLLPKIAYYNGQTISLCI